MQTQSTCNSIFSISTTASEKYWYCTHARYQALKPHNYRLCTTNTTSLCSTVSCPSTQVFVCRCKWMPLFSPHLSAWTHRLDAQRGYDLHCAAPFKNLSPHRRARHKSQVVDWDIPSWLWARGLGPVMNAAIICWCMKREVHHHFLHIKPWQSLLVLVSASAALRA